MKFRVDSLSSLNCVPVNLKVLDKPRKNINLTDLKHKDSKCATKNYGMHVFSSPTAFV